MLQIEKKDGKILVELDPPGFKGVAVRIVVLGLDDKEKGFANKVDNFLGYFINLGGSYAKVLPGIVQEAAGKSTSFRNFNSNLKRAMNIHVVAAGLMTNAEFQSEYFYEGTMEGRAGVGAKAPWLGQEKAVDESNVEITNVTGSKRFNPDVKSKTAAYKWDLTQEWDQINKPIAERLAES